MKSTLLPVLLQQESYLQFLQLSIRTENTSRQFLQLVVGQVPSNKIIREGVDIKQENKANKGPS